MCENFAEQHFFSHSNNISTRYQFGWYLEIQTGSRTGPQPRHVQPPVLARSLFSQCMRRTQSWYQVDHPNYSRQGPHDLTEYYSYSEEGSDRRSKRAAVPHLQRLGVSLPRREPRPDRAQTGVALAQQSSARAIPGGTPALHLDLPQEEDRGFDGGGGFDRRQRVAYPTAP